MAELKGTNTEKNLQAAFAGESQAFQKYTFYAAAARKAGMNEIADYFEETAHNESAHAKLWFKALHGGDVSSDIEANLRDAAAGENYEHTTMYKDFADEAEKEGFAKIAYQMREVGKIEARHEAVSYTHLDVYKRQSKHCLLQRKCPHHQRRSRIYRPYCIRWC